MRRRLATLGHGFTAAQSGASDIVVTAPKSRAGEWSRIVRLLAPPARLRLFDWEANVLTPNGRTVASQLAAQDGTATSVSQGGPYGAGFPGPGSMSLYDAVTLAARQPRVLGSRSLSRAGPEYYMFGAAGSAACAADARQLGAARPVFTTSRCLLAGPVDVAASVSRGRAIHELAAQLPRGVTASRRPGPGRPAGHGRGPGRTTQPRHAGADREPGRAVLRPAGPRGADWQRHHQPQPGDRSVGGGRRDLRIHRDRSCRVRAGDACGRPPRGRTSASAARP